MKNLCFVGALAVSAGALGTAFACNADDLTPTRVAVTFKTADLSNPAKAQNVRARLYKAAQYVCESEGEGPKWREADDRACEAEAMQKAEQQLAASRNASLSRNDQPHVRALVERR
jgi:UrcA family protein